MTTDNANAKAEVIDQSTTVGKLPTGNYGPVVRIIFRTAKGYTGSVDVPQSEYTAVKARAAIDAHATELDAV